MADFHEGEPLLAGEAEPQATNPASSVCVVIKEELHELKWAVLAAACFLTFGSYYIFDFPGSIGTGPENTIESEFRQRGKEYSQSMNQMLYSVYSWPNTVLAVFGGLLIDKFLGLRRAMLLFTALIVAGSLMFYIGLRSTSFPVMLCGRVVFGLGGESLSVAQSAFVARWFKGGRGMALAFGITISFSRVGSSFNFLFSPVIAKRAGVEMAVLAGCGACCVSLLSCFILILADIYATRTGYVKPESRDVVAVTGSTGAREDGASDGQQPTSALLPASSEEDPNVMKLSDIVRLPLRYWLLCIICVACYTAIFPFIGIARNFFEAKYGYTASQAARQVSSYQLTSAVASPIIGLVVDAVGRNTVWLAAASLAFMLAHIVFTFTMIPAVVIMVAMGGFYSFLVSGLWPSIPFAVSENIVGVSYGVMTAIQNIGLASFPIAVGAILDRHTPKHGGGSASAPEWDSESSPSESISLWSSSSSSTLSGAQSSRMSAFACRSLLPLPQSTGVDSTGGSGGGGELTLPTMDGYFWVEVLFFAAATVSFVASVVLFVVDVRGDGILSASSSRRRKIQASKAEEDALLSGIIPESQRGRLDNVA